MNRCAIAAERGHAGRNHAPVLRLLTRNFAKPPQSQHDSFETRNLGKA